MSILKSPRYRFRLRFMSTLSGTKLPGLKFNKIGDLDQIGLSQLNAINKHINFQSTRLIHW